MLGNTYGATPDPYDLSKDEIDQLRTNSRKFEDIVNQRELAEYLGLGVRGLANLHGLSAIRLGAQRVYFKQDVVEYLMARRARQSA